MRIQNRQKKDKELYWESLIVLIKDSLVIKMTELVLNISYLIADDIYEFNI